MENEVTFRPEEQLACRQRLNDWTLHAIKFNSATAGGAVIGFVALAANVKLNTLPFATSLLAILSAVFFMLALLFTGVAIASQFTFSWQEAGEQKTRNKLQSSWFAERSFWQNGFGRYTPDLIVFGFFMLIFGMFCSIGTFISWVIS